MELWIKAQFHHATGRCPALKLLEQLRLQTINTLKWHLLSKPGFFNIWPSPNKLCTGHLRFTPGTILPRVSERHEHLWAKVQHDVWTSLKCAPNVLMLSLSSFETQSMQIAMNLCLLNLERIRTLHNGYPATPDLHYCEVTSSNHPCKFKSRASGLDAVTTRHAPHATQPSILCFSEYSKVNLGLKNLMLSMRLAVLCCLCPSCFGIRRKQSFTCWKKGSGNEDKFLDLVEKTREFQFGLVGLWFQTKVLAWPSCGLRMLASN